MPNRKVTIQDVAKEAGVSTATVSRVMNQNYPVSEKLQKRINNAIEKLDYHPNAIARTLKTNSTNTIGFLVSDIANPMFTAILKGVEDVIHKHNFNVISCSTDGYPDKEMSYLKLLLEKKVDGIILNTTGYNEDYIVHLSQSIPIVLSNRSIDNKNFIGDLVGSDDVSGIQSLTEHLIALGHQKIGVINGTLNVSTGRDRYAGFVKAMNSAGHMIDKQYPFITNIGFDSKSGYLGAKRLLESSERPTALIITNNELTFGALRYCRENGVRIPEELSVVAFGEITNAELLYIQPTISTFSHSTLGNKLGELILERIKAGNHNNNLEVRYMPSLVLGNSTQVLPPERT